MKKRVISLLLCAILLFTYGTVLSFAADDVNGPDFDADSLKLSFTKTWDDDDNVQKRRPESITVKLYMYSGDEFDPAAAILVETAAVRKSDGWKYDFDISDQNPLDDNGNAYRYKIIEDPVVGYEESKHTDPTYRFFLPAITDGWDSIKPCNQLDIVTDDGSGFRSLVVAKKGSNFVVWSYLPLTEPERKLVFSSASKEVGGMKENQTTYVSGIGSVFGGMTVNEDQILFTKPSDWSWFLTGTYYKGSVETTNSSVENKLLPSTVSITVTKKWVDADNQDGIRPNEIYAQLLADGKEVDGKILTLNANNNWSDTFADLPEYDGSEKIAYSVAEPKSDGYESHLSGDMTGGFVLTNSHTPETVDIRGSKTWDDNNNQDGKRPASITVHLMKNGSKVDSKTVTEQDGWAWSFTGQDKYLNGKPINYSVIEEQVDGYATTYDGYNIKNSYTPKKTSISVIKRWEDASDQDGLRTDKVTVRLIADGSPVSGRILVLSDDNRWTGSFSGLDQYRNGKPIRYSLEEIKVDGYATTIEGTAADGFVIVNRHQPETTEVKGVKTWDDDNDRDGKRPASITVHLLKNGSKIDSKTVTEQDGWAWSFTGLAKYEDHGKPVRYTVAEEPVAGYTTVYDGFHIKNSYTPETTEVKGVKTWDDDNDRDGKRPASITVHLLKNGSKIDSKTVTEQDGWAWSFTGLAKYEDHGKPVRYTVAEEPVAGYTTVYDGFHIKNSYTPERIVISVRKVWDDDSNRNGSRPESITVHLLENGKVMDGVALILNEENGWVGSFENLNAYADGQRINYSVEEVEVNGYRTVISGNPTDGFTVTNHLIRKESPHTGRFKMLGYLFLLNALGFVGAVSCVVGMVKKDH